MRKDSFLARGGGWVAGQSILMIAVVVLAVLFSGQWHSPAGIVAGAALVLLGGGLGIAGVVVLGNSRTPFPKPPAGATLVRHGVYGWVRHPLYTSVILASCGWGLLWQSGPALAAAAALALFLNAKARREERWLREKFAEYPDYQNRVRRFIPWIG